ncbi:MULTISPECIES: MobF family relaxase [Rhodococcus erythropolis group]|nr:MULTISPECIES: MobF family relaxase [Rhodococcus erythropolis group]MDJ0434674.1 MobF family relaxase [Rhodococcus qingshengii]
MVTMMTIHKLSAGDGYTYLTKHVAAGDATESKKKDVVDYYNAKGTPPGRWFGKATTRAGVAVGDEVTENAMRAAFGAARKPNAFDTMPAITAPHADRLDWSASTALGSAFSSFTESQEYVHEVEERCSDYKRAHGEYPDTAAKDLIKHDLAVKHLTKAQAPKSGLISEQEVMKFITDSYNKMRQPVAGYDLVFTPAKSISLLWGLGDPRVKEAIEAAHKQAVDESLGWIEDEVTYTRRGKAGARVIKAEGLLAARFDHWDNRVGDPNLHTHCAVLNRVFAEDKWTTIDGRMFYRSAVAASERYNTRVADLVARKLGVTFAPRADTPVGKQPVYEVEGIPISLIEEFSRRQAIVDRQAELANEYVERHGKNPPKKVQYAQAQQATLDTRNAKNPPRSMAELRAEWDERARAIVVDTSPQELVELAQTGHDKRPPFGPEDLPELIATVEEDLSRKVGTWTVYSLTAEVQRQVRAFSFADDLDLDVYVKAAVETLVKNHCIPVFTEIYSAPESLSERVEGGLVRLHTVDRTTMRYTSESVLAAEKYMRNKADAASELTVPDRVIRRQIRRIEKQTRKEINVKDFALGNDQIAMIEHFLTAKTKVAVAVGAAGAGKTTAAKVVARAWEQTNGKVIALGPSAKAADVLGAEIDVEGRTIADILTRDQHGLPTGIEKGDLLLVDEAGMASARNLADLTRIATQAGAVVRLLGDPLQLASVESGGVLRDLAERTDAPFLSKIHRFKTVGEAAASLQLRDGDESALAWYQKEDRIREAMKHELPDKVFEAYVADVEEEKVTLMVAPTNDLVRELNLKATAYYRDKGTVTGDGILLADGLEGSLGDVVVTRKNNSKYVVKDDQGKRTGRVNNGDLWTIVEVGVDGSLRLENNVSGGRVVVAADYVADNVQLGYAATVHRSQGMTVGACHVLTDSGMDRQGFYVAMTRGKQKNIAYAASDELPDWDFEHRPDEHPGALGVISGIIARDGSQRTAHQMMEEAQAHAESFEAIKQSYLSAVGALYEEHTSALLNEILPDRQFTWVHTFGGWDSIVESVAKAETFGWDTRRLLVDAANVMREKGKAGKIDEHDNAPGKIMAEALDSAIKSQETRQRSDEVARYRVPALTDAVAAQDKILGSYARANIEQMHAFVDTYVEKAIREQAPWIVALGNPGNDPRKQALLHTAATEVGLSRVLNNVGNEVTDPYAYLSEVRADVVGKQVEQIKAKPAAATVYSSYSTGDLATATASAKRRISDTRQMLGQAKRELARATDDSSLGAVNSVIAEVEADAQKIAEVRRLRDAYDRIQRDPTASAAQRDQARTAMTDAEAGAPAEQRWGAIEISAAANRANQGRRERAGKTDDRVLGALNTRITRLEKVLASDRARLELLEKEKLSRRGNPSTHPDRPRPRTEDADLHPEQEPPTIDRGTDNGPEL